VAGSGSISSEERVALTPDRPISLSPHRWVEAGLSPLVGVSAQELLGVGGQEGLDAAVDRVGDRVKEGKDLVQVAGSRGRSCRRGDTVVVVRFRSGVVRPGGKGETGWMDRVLRGW
jgi:hypothetical protein